MKKKNAGFTLMELMIVVGILSIIAAITVPNLLSSRKRSQEGAAVATMRSIGTAEMSYMTAGEVTNTNGTPLYGDFKELTNGKQTGTAYIDGTWASITARAGYKYVLSTVTGPPVGFTLTSEADDTKVQRSFRTDESGSIIGKFGGIPTDMTDGTPIN